jgi:IS4 transposase
LITTISPFQFAFHHLGFGKSVSRSNLSKANEVRDVRIFQEFADRMVSIARSKVDGIKDFFLSNKVYAFDSSTISLCLSVYWWTKMHHGKGGVKLHTLYDVKTDIPAFIVITDAALHDSQVMGLIPYEKDSFYVFDRAYMDTKMLYLIHKREAFFVVREKHKMVFDVVEDKNYSNPTTGVMADQIIQFKGYKTRKNYSETLRRVIFYDKEGNRTFVFYTNNFDITAEEVALLYKFRWRVELFFYDKYIIMQSKVRSMSDSQRLVILLLTSTSHNNSHFPRSLSQSRRSLLFSHSRSESRLGTRSAYAFSSASRLAFESARA